MQEDAKPDGERTKPARERAQPSFVAVVDALRWGEMRDWAELVRLPNVFTVLSDSLAAAILVSGSALFTLTWVWISLALAVFASVLTYWGGMILNDVVDLEEDRLNRSGRPLVQGRVSPVLAGHIGNAMLLVAPIVILLATNTFQHQPLWMGAAFLASMILSLSVRAYDSSLKHSLAGPLLMGLCRALNIVMVGCVMLSVVNAEVAIPRSLLFMAAGIGVYIVGITVFARREESDNQPSGLGLGLLLEVAGFAIIAALPYLSQVPNSLDPNSLDQNQARWQLDPFRAYPVLIGLIGLTVVNRGVQALNHPVSRKVQLAVKHAILTLILLDASIAALSAGPWFGGAIALLLLPALAVGARFRST